MKRIFIVFALLVLGCGCTKVLDKTIQDQVTTGTYWNTPTDLELYVNRFYPNLTKGGDEYGGTAYFSYDASSDNLQPAAADEVLAGARSVPTTGGGWNWTGIRNVNYFFENAAKVTSGSQSEINQYIGEAYFFRALFYFQLVQQFGDIPWYSKVLNINSAGLEAPRDPRNQVMDSIVKNLDQAIGFLQLKKQIPAGRINKGCALLLKSRVCLYEGTWEKYHAGTVFGVKGANGEAYLKLAAQSAKELMDENNFHLYATGHPDNDYWTLFSSNDLAGNPEVILARTTDPALALGNWSWTYLNGTRGNGTGITKSLVDAYLCKDGLSISSSKEYEGDTTVLQAVQNRDPRLQQTMWVPGQTEINTQPPLIYKDPPIYKGGADESTTGYMIRKGSTPDPEQNKGSSSSKYGEVDGIVFRYAEALLNYAEATAELADMGAGTFTQNDLDISVNLLRDRAGMPHMTTGVSIDPVLAARFPEVSGSLKNVILEIRRERRVELALEGFRHDDLMRWAATNAIRGKRWKGARVIKDRSFPDIENMITGIPLDADHYIDRYHGSLPDGFKFNPGRDYLSPIPVDELTLNKNLKQNPGW
jgi:hypothetical protein